MHGACRASYGIQDEKRISSSKAKGVKMIVWLCQCACVHALVFAACICESLHELVWVRGRALMCEYIA